MEILLNVLLFGLFGYSQAIHCDKELNYHENYGYGTDVICEGLTNDNEKLLRDISIYNEIMLKINKSNLTKVTSDLFSNVPKIRYFIISNSTFLFKTNEEPFKDMESLEHFTVANTNFSELNNHTFQRLVKLKELNLLNNSLQTIKEADVEFLKNLEILKLSNNKFKSIFDVPICVLPKLKYFYMDNNQIEALTQSNTFCSEKNQYSGIHLNGKPHPIKYDKNNVIHRTKPSLNLIELDLSNNKISKIESLDWAIKLKSINLENNKIKVISNSLFSYINNLEKLNLKNNVLENIEFKAFSRLVQLKSVDLENNKLTEVHLENLPKLKKLNLSKNKIVSANLKYLNNLSNLQILLLNNNNIVGELPKNIFQNFSSLTILDLSNNNLIITDGIFNGLSNLKELRIKNSSIADISLKSLNFSTNLQILDLSANKLKKFSDFQASTGLDNLQILNLSYNLLENLDYDLLKSLHNLQVLDIAGNKLRNFQFDHISLLPSLRMFNIKSNLLSCDVLLKIITYLKKQSVSYTINEEFQYDKKNIGGIYCEEIKNEEDKRGRWVSQMIIIFTGAVSLIVLSIVLYKFLQFSRRRRYTMDEIELIEE